MRPADLLLYTLDELEGRIALRPRRSYNLLRAAGLVRQLIADGNSLVPEVNRWYLTKLRFTVPDAAPPEGRVAFHFVNLGATGGKTKPVTLDQFDPSAVKLVGNVGGTRPFRGTLRHRGWRIEWLELPRRVEGSDARVIAPAEVEL